MTLSSRILEKRREEKRREEKRREEKRREEKRREEKRREERVVRADLCAQNFREPISQTHPARGTSAPAVRLFFVSPRSAKGGGVHA